MIRTFAIAPIALSLALVGTPALAGSHAVEQSSTVSYADLDLTRATDVARFDNRIEGAAKRVCGGTPGRSLKEKMSFSACYSDALASARQTAEQAVAAAKAAGQLASLEAR